MNKSVKFILAISLQLVIIFSIIIFKLAILAGGTTVDLQIRPVDPRDPLRGDYMTFSYIISEVPGVHVTGLPSNGDTVYVPLRKTGKYWSVSKGVDTKKPDSSKLFIKGVVMSGGDGSQGLFKQFGYDRNRKLRVKYNIEEFYIPEGSGRGVIANGKDNYAKVVIDGNGNAVLKQIYLDDKAWP